MTGLIIGLITTLMVVGIILTIVRIRTFRQYLKVRIPHAQFNWRWVVSENWYYRRLYQKDSLWWVSEKDRDDPMYAALRV